MTVALIQIEPLDVVQIFPSVPDPVTWPDGAASHGIEAGFVRGNYGVFSGMNTPERPNEFYFSVGTPVPTFDGTTVLFVQNWKPVALADAQTTLLQRIDAAAEFVRMQYITPGSGQTYVYLEKLRQAKLYLNATSNTAIVDGSQFPLLAASGGVIKDTANLIVSTALTCDQQLAAVETIRLSAKSAIRSALTIEDALAAAGAVKWSS